ncbi:hypothetical protein WN944_003565 [Citrus x changshan-huyou]|uniref:cytokinin riboside 5'-monophosphate phosphoribohydrolase n=1 Tax=Citrus x changshan-huyou TaxID=2935761 RepID=A0AAP0LYR9_9ROSI
MAASSSRQFKNICVLSGFHYRKYKEFIQAPVDLGRAIAERKLHLVYGGGDRGLSKLSTRYHSTSLKTSRCVSDVPIGEELVVSSMQEQISEMLNHADAFIFLPGDLATLEALITFASWAHLNIHKKPIAYKPESDPKTLALEWLTNDGNPSPTNPSNAFVEDGRIWGVATLEMHLQRLVQV